MSDDVEAVAPASFDQTGRDLLDDLLFDFPPCYEMDRNQRLPLVDWLLTALRSRGWRHVPEGWTVVPDPAGWEQGKSHSFPLSAVEKEK